jgi:hypothetical protein
LSVHLRLAELSLDVICENEKMIKRRMPRSSGVR